jgi:hypothetical protein
VIPEIVMIALALACGLGVALVIDRRALGAAIVGEALLFGIGICSALLLIIPWTRPAFFGSVAIFGLGSAAAWRRFKSGAKAPHSKVAYVFHTVTIVALIGYALFATVGPVWEYDFLVDWGLKARVFWEGRGIDWPFLQSAWQRAIHPDYPPLLPFAFDAVAIIRGDWSDRWLGILNVAFACALLLIVYRLAVEELRSPANAAFITTAMVPFAATPWIGIAEGPFIAYATAALLLIRIGRTLPGAVMLGLAAFTKNEGLTLIVAVAIALAATRRWRDIVRLWPAIVIPAPWLVTRSLHRLPTDITSGNVIARILQHLSDPGLFSALALYPLGKRLFWLGILIGIALTFRRLIARERFLLAALGFQFLFYVAAYLATPHDVQWHVRWSWERLVSHLTPALTTLLLLNLAALWRPASD